MCRLFKAGSATLASAVIVGLGFTAWSAWAASPSGAAGATPPFEFRRLLIASSGDAPEACFRFSQSLRPEAEAHYGDYVQIEPETPLAIRTSDKDLCIGGLTYGTQYKVTLRHGLPAQSGALVEAEQVIDVSLGDREPLVSISGQGFILPRASSNGLAIQTINVDSVKVRVLRMSDRLLPSQIDHGNRSFFGSDGGALLSGVQMSRYQLRELLKRSASVIWSGTMAIESDHNRTVQTAFPLSSIVKPGQSGVYLVIAEPAAKATADKFFASAKDENRDDDFDEMWTAIPAHWVIATDIALTALSGADGLHVFARSLASGDPLSGIKLTLLAAGQDVLGEAASDGDGAVAFAPGLLRGSGANAAASVVAYGEAGDFALLDLNRPAFDLSDRGVTGRPTAAAIEAFLYTERGIYRPGETVEVMTLLRDRVGVAIDTMPVTLILRRPDGIEAKRLAVPAQPQGGFHHSLTLTKTAARGLWSAEAYVDPSGAPVGRVEFEVQDFVPQKLKVTVTATQPFLRPGEAIDVAVNGDFLYGAPAAELNGEAELRIVRDPTPIAEAKAYSFGLADEQFEETVQQLEMKPTDEAGHAELSDVVQPPKPTSFPLKGVLSAGLFEPSGRIVKDQVELPIRTGKPLIGIRPRFADNRAEEGQEASFDIRAFAEDGTAIARPALKWQLIRENRVFDWFNGNGNGWTWHYHVVDEPLGSGTIDAAESAPTTFGQVVDWGWYRLVVSDPTTDAATSVRFQAGWQAAGETADTPDKLEIGSEKTAYAVGDTARLRISGPFAGKAQVTIASDRVFETHAIAVPKGGTTIEVKVGADWGAGAYAVVSLYRPLTEGRARDPVRAVGVAWLAIDPAPRTLAVAVGAPDKVTPRQHVAVPIKVTGPVGDGQAYITLAAVDEGILQLTRFATPDPAPFFFGKRKLGIDIRDDYGRLLDGSAVAGDIREGGDEGIGGAGLPVTSTRTVALFSGPVALDRDGAATIDLDVPDFEGQLRLMAVAYNHSAVGRGEGHLIVRDPVIADLALPRFLAPGDTARLAMLLHNTDGVAGAYHLAVTSNGAARISADHPLDYTLGSGDQKVDNLTIEGLDEGVATIATDLTGPNGYEVRRDFQIAVRAAHYPLALEESAVQAPGEVFRVDAEKLKPFVPGSVSISLGYSAFTGIDVASLLQSLYRYPYGCTEQLSSSAFPLIYFNDPGLLGNIPQDTGVKARVQAAIDTIIDRADAAGQFGLWRAGDGEASPWLNVYALDFLVHARDAGFTVPDAALQRSFAWIKQTIRQVDQENHGYYMASPDATRAYAGYVLARAGRADIGELRRAHDAMSWSIDHDDHVTPASVYWARNQNDDRLAQPLSLGQLAGALSLMGDRARSRHAFALAIANLDIKERYPHWWFDYTYYSGMRDLAGLIAISAEIGDSKTAAMLIDRLKALSPSAERLNTQEKAWLLAAAHAFNADNRSRALSVDGKDVSNLKLPAAFAPTLAEVAAGYQVKNTGDRDIWRTVVIRGAPKLAPSAMEAGFSLEREYLSLDGDQIDPAQLRQNDRLIVSLSGSAADSDSHRAVLVDLLPAGWEIEAVITKSETYDFLAPLTRPKVAEARDDRFVAAFDLGQGLNEGRRRYYSEEQDDNAKHLPDGAFHVAYLVRVVTPGSFTLPEAVIEDMYRPGVMARTDSGQTTAAPR
jgi:uncharacterized protein YfaS (alpha-2-macroglobulin family)